MMTQTQNISTGFLKLFTSKKRMMNLEFLALLELKEIFKLSMLCFELYKTIDENRFIDDDQY